MEKSSIKISRRQSGKIAVTVPYNPFYIKKTQGYKRALEKIVSPLDRIEKEGRIEKS